MGMVSCPAVCHRRPAVSIDSGRSSPRFGFSKVYNQKVPLDGSATLDDIITFLILAGIDEGI